TQRRLAARVLRAWGRLVAALGRRVEPAVRMDPRAFRVEGADGEAGHPGVALDRRRARTQRRNRPGSESARPVLLGTRTEQPDARNRDGGGDEEARLARRHRSLP